MGYIKTNKQKSSVRAYKKKDGIDTAAISKGEITLARFQKKIYITLIGVKIKRHWFKT